MRVEFMLSRSGVTPDNNPETLVEIVAAANHRIEVVGLDIGFQGSTPASSPIPLGWYLAPTGQATPTGLTAQKNDRGQDETVLGTFQHYASGTEPTGVGTELIAFSLHQQGNAFWRPPFPIVIKGGETVSLLYRSATFVNFSFTVFCQQ